MYDHYTVIIINILIIIIIIIIVTVVVVSRAYDFLRKKWIFFAADFYIFRGVLRRVKIVIRILKSQSNGPLYSSPLLAVPNVTAHPSTANVPSSYYLMWPYNCL